MITLEEAKAFSSTIGWITFVLLLFLLLSGILALKSLAVFTALFLILFFGILMGAEALILNSEEARNVQK